MTPLRIVYLERMVWLISFIAVTAGVVAFDWRVGLIVGGTLLGLANADLPILRRRP
jgi:hypothetical protein